MNMTIAGWILFVTGILIIFLIAGYVAHLFWESKNGAGVALSLILSFLLCIGLYCGMHWWFNNTAAGARTIKTQQSNFRNGIERIVTVYDINGNVIETYEGKFDVTYDSDRILFDDENGKRHNEDMGAEEYRYMATLDEVTCDVCAPLDGQIFKVSEWNEGINAPVMHPRCRCTTTIAMQFGKRRGRNPISGKNEILSDMSYDEWRQSMTDEEKQAFETAQRSYRNKASDKAQLKRYREVLGKENVPKTLDAWQNLKYNDKEQWKDLKGFCRYKLNNKDASRNDYNCVKELKEKFPQGSFHIPPKQIDLAKLSFDDEHINKQRNHNVTEQMAKGFITGAKASRTVWNGRYERFYAFDGATYVNIETNDIRTSYSVKEFDKDTLQIVEVLKKHGI